MPLTRVAKDPWSESHTVPSFLPPPVSVRSEHVPLTAERAEVRSIAACVVSGVPRPEETQGLLITVAAVRRRGFANTLKLYIRFQICASIMTPALGFRHFYCATSRPQAVVKSHIERAAIASAPSVELGDNDVAALLEGCAEQLLEGAGSRTSRRSSYEHHGPAPTSPGNLIKRAVAAATSKWNSLMQKQQPHQLHIRTTEAGSPVHGGSPRRSGWAGHDSVEPAELHSNLGELMDSVLHILILHDQGQSGAASHFVLNTDLACPQHHRPTCTVQCSPGSARCRTSPTTAF